MDDYTSGYWFEDEVYYTLKTLPFGTAITPKPVYSKELKKPTQIDLIFITDKVIYSIEVKSAWYLAGSINDKRWWSSTKGSKNVKIINPYLQNMMHILAIKRLLWRNGFGYMPFKNIVVVTDKAVIDSDCKCLCRASELRRKIINDYKKSYNEDVHIDIEKVYNILK